MHTLDFLIIIVAKNLHCHSQLPEKLAEGQEKATGLRTRCDAETSYCWKSDTPGGIGQGCADRDVQEVVTYAVGQLSDSCATMELETHIQSVHVTATCVTRHLSSKDQTDSRLDFYLRGYPVFIFDQLGEIKSYWGLGFLTARSKQQFLCNIDFVYKEVVYFR